MLQAYTDERKFLRTTLLTFAPPRDLRQLMRTFLSAGRLDFNKGKRTELNFSTNCRVAVCVGSFVERQTLIVRFLGSDDTA